MEFIYLLSSDCYYDVCDVMCVYVCVWTVRPMHVQLHEGQHMCAVCNDVANGIHFGAVTCEGCKVH